MATIHTPLDRFTNLSVSAFLFVASATAGYAESRQSSPPLLPPTAAAVTITVEESGPAASAVQFTTATSSETTPFSWSDIKDCTAEMRGQFLAGLQRMEVRVNAQLSELTAKRATLKTAANTKNLDHALNELSNARFFLKTMGERLSRATPQTWEQQKAKVGLAWTKSQAAYAQAKTHTTS